MTWREFLSILLVSTLFPDALVSLVFLPQVCPLLSPLALFLSLSSLLASHNFLLLSAFEKKVGGKSLKGSRENTAIERPPTVSVLATWAPHRPRAGRPMVSALRPQTGTGGSRGGILLSAVVLCPLWSIYRVSSLQQVRRTLLQRSTKLLSEAWAGKIKWKNPQSKKERD